MVWPCRLCRHGCLHQASALTLPSSRRNIGKHIQRFVNCQALPNASKLQRLCVFAEANAVANATSRANTCCITRVVSLALNCPECSQGCELVLESFRLLSFTMSPTLRASADLLSCESELLDIRFQSSSCIRRCRLRTIIIQKLEPTDRCSCYPACQKVAVAIPAMAIQTCVHAILYLAKFLKSGSCCDRCQTALDAGCIANIKLACAWNEPSSCAHVRCPQYIAISCYLHVFWTVCRDVCMKFNDAKPRCVLLATHTDTHTRFAMLNAG